MPIDTRIKEYGYEYEAEVDFDLAARTKGKTVSANDRLFDALAMRSGRDCLYAIARQYEPLTVLIPALSCDSMVTPFRKAGHKVAYYQLNEDYSIKLDKLRELLSDKPMLLLYMDYFGLPAATDEALEQLQKEYPKLIFIEDRTENILLPRESEFQPDYVMGSLRKWLPVPDGGLLWSEKSLTKEIGSSSEFAETRRYAQALRYDYLRDGDTDKKAEFRPIFSGVSDLIDEDKLPSYMSEYGYELAKRADISFITSAREKNAAVLISALKAANIKLINASVGSGDLYVGILVDNRDGIQKRLAERGIFATIIWPLDDEQKAACEVAKYTTEHMLAIYCDQRYDEDDMKHVAQNIVEIING